MIITSPININEGIKYLNGLKRLHKKENKKIEEIINLLQWYKERWDWHTFCESVPDFTLRRTK